jgi:hypothetical protein
VVRVQGNPDRPTTDATVPVPCEHGIAELVSCHEPWGRHDGSLTLDAVKSHP